MINMALTRVVLLAVVGALIATPIARGATVKNGSPRLSDYRGKPVAVVFFHPL